MSIGVNCSSEGSDSRDGYAGVWEGEVVWAGSEGRPDSGGEHDRT